jgi:hypothetical protein
MGTTGKGRAVSDLEITPTDPESVPDLQQDPPVTRRECRREARALPI